MRSLFLSQHASTQRFIASVRLSDGVPVFSLQGAVLRGWAEGAPGGACVRHHAGLLRRSAPLAQGAAAQRRGSALLRFALSRRELWGLRGALRGGAASSAHATTGKLLAFRRRHAGGRAAQECAGACSISLSLRPVI